MAATPPPSAYTTLFTRDVQRRCAGLFTGHLTIAGAMCDSQGQNGSVAEPFKMKGSATDPLQNLSK